MTILVALLPDLMAVVSVARLAVGSRAKIADGIVDLAAEKLSGSHIDLDIIDGLRVQVKDWLTVDEVSRCVESASLIALAGIFGLLTDKRFGQLAWLSGLLWIVVAVVAGWPAGQRPEAPADSKSKLRRMIAMFIGSAIISVSAKFVLWAQGPG
jgi:hypothetical protein